MKNNFVFFVLIIFLCSCHHIDDTQYEKIYFHDFKKDSIGNIQPEIAKSEEKKEISGSVISNVPLENKIKTSDKVMESQKTKKTKKKGRIKIGELTIESDTMTFNKVTSEAVFQGNVRLKSEGVNLFCDKLQSINYRDNAEATGNVVVKYQQQKVKIICKKIKYDKAISIIEGYENVQAEKILDNNEKINLYADKIKYDVETGEILAEKINKKVKIKLKDIVAFSDRVVYNETTDEMELTGNPFARKQESVFISNKINIDINKMQIKLQKNIWAKLFYSDFEDIKKEISVEKDNY
jgi:lipopolysaccharide export system protein LptA